MQDFLSLQVVFYNGVLGFYYQVGEISIVYMHKWLSGGKVRVEWNAQKTATSEAIAELAEFPEHIYVQNIRHST